MCSGNSLNSYVIYAAGFEITPLLQKTTIFHWAHLSPRREVHMVKRCFTLLLKRFCDVSFDCVVSKLLLKLDLSVF